MSIDYQAGMSVIGMEYQPDWYNGETKLKRPVAPRTNRRPLDGPPVKVCKRCGVESGYLKKGHCAECRRIVFNSKETAEQRKARREKWKHGN